MKRDSTRVLWRVQVRKSRKHKWVAKGTFETRKDAREKCAELRGEYNSVWQCYVSDYALGFGNTRVVRVEKG